MITVNRDVYGGEEVLRIEKNMPLTNLAADELLIDVECTTVNRTDCHILAGTPLIFRLFIGVFKPKYKSTGSDFAGVVTKIGKKVEKFEVGDRVFGFHDEGLGSHRSKLIISTSKPIEKIPEKVSFENAVCSLEGFHYAYSGFSKIKLAPKSRVLVNGSTGAIGSVLVQLLINNGHTVTTVCRKEHFGIMLQYGVSKTIDYQKEDFTKLNHSFDFVLDAVGKSSFLKCKSILNNNGLYTSSELGKGCINIFWALISFLPLNKRMKFPIPSNIPRSINKAKDLLASGKFKPLIDKKYNAKDIKEAFKYVKTGEKVGNVIISFR